MSAISAAEYEKFMRGHSITGCAVRGDKFLHFIARNDEEAERAGAISEASVTKLMVAFYPHKEHGSRLGSREFKGYQRLMIGASQRGEDKVVCVSSDGDVFTSGGGSSGEEMAIPKRREGPRRGAVQRVRMVGDTLYAVGSGHTVCRRRGPGDWESLGLDLPLETRADAADAERSADMAFEDIDGFSANDLYAVAGRGRVWHCDGSRWTPLAFPSNMLLHSVCCAGDGQVYIGAQSGAVFRGRGEQWTLVHRGDMTLPFKDIVWHAGKVWATSDHGLWQIGPDRLVAPELPSEIAVCAGHLSVAGGTLLLAGTHGAAYHQGGEWHVIFNRHAMER